MSLKTVRLMGALVARGQMLPGGFVARGAVQGLGGVSAMSAINKSQLVYASV